MTNEHISQSTARQQYEYRRKKNKEGMKAQVITFVLTIFLTLISFAAVGFEIFPVKFVVPFILLLAVVQVIFQLYYFMHASEKEHEMPMFFMYSAMVAAFVTILAMVTIVWW